MGYKQTDMETKRITRSMKSRMKDCILEALLSYDGRCSNTSVLQRALLSPSTFLVRLRRRALLFQMWNKHNDNLTHQVCQWGLAPQPCLHVCVTSFACICMQDSLGNLQRGFLFLSLSLSLTKETNSFLFSYSAADAVSLVLLTSIWLPVPSHKARWNYNPTLHSLSVGTYLSYASYLYFDKMRIFDHHKMMITF